MKQGEYLIQWIEDTYGSPEELGKVLDYGIEMLFYLEPDSFDPIEVREVVSAIRGLIVGLRS
ncbi:hypothetical protein KIM67_05085 [Flagellimonas sp. 389]|uniref:hypothetical protein n=1 Tax=Flagellimonas sp. 389 TaxID=2835862 RepID=UPI001BD33CC2|nr:hypothetical protein [Flagellimonas sp. 389]MBS9461774.1 hypothetical protein [Flagellimonas sp. 389]